jgi:CRISPR-associated protein Csm1
MNDTVLKIALAGLLHDIGKFAQGCMEIPQKYRDDNEDIYQPKREGRPTHRHALYTAAFLEQFGRLLPSALTAKNWGEGDIFLNLAACHHKPETPMQWVVTMADRISSGQDRATFEKGESIAWQDFKKTRLLPILECLDPNQSKKFTKADAFQYRYPLAPVSAGYIFPGKAVQLDKKSAEQEYQTLFDEFVEKLTELWHRESNVSLWAQHLDSLLMTYTSMIPAARVGDVVHDVSLYDHSRTTAAFASALYLYHQQTGTLNEKAIREGDTEKFLLVSGDFYGIQDFIFSTGGESQTHRSKLLRGRSFAVSLFSELAADMLCRELGLPPFAVILNAAGKFHLIAPNTDNAQKAISRVQQKVNSWLFAISYGQSSMGVTATPAAQDAFQSHNFLVLWEKHLQGMEQKKFQKIDLEQCGGAVTDFLDGFDNTLAKDLCPLCGKRPSVKEAENDRIIYPDENGSACAICRDHVMLGTQLVKGKRLAVCDLAIGLKKDKVLLSPIFGRYQLIFTDDPMEEAADNGTLLKLWELEVNDDGRLDSRTTNRLINGHVPRYRQGDNEDNCLLASARSEEKTFDLIDQIKEGVPKTFGHIAVKARHWNQENNRCQGTEALGVLKADVDKLGILFGCGLPDERFTLSRLATMSRQLNNFFSLYLPYLLRTSDEFYDVYTVFAGGDDLFLVGPWNRMAALASLLRERFTDYVAHNPEITFSAGITVHKPNTPVNKLASASEEALEHAKDGGRNRITMFDETVTWDAFVPLLKNRATMEEWLERKLLSRGMLYRFNHLVSLADKEKMILKQSKIGVADMECLKWRSQFRYSLARNIDTRLKGEERDKAVAEVAELAEWLHHHGGAVRIPLWHMLYEIRR